MKRSIWLALAILSACAPRSPSSQPHRASRAEDAAEDGAAYLTDFAKAAALAGGSPLEVLASGAGIPGDSLLAFVSIPKGRCALLAARGADQMGDLDLYLFGDDGDEIAASDDIEQPATLLHCAGTEDERVLAVARIAAGRGPYALGLVDAPIERESAIARQLLAGSGGAAGQAEDWPGLDAALSAHRDMLGGSWRDVRRVIVPVDHRVPTQVDLSVDARRCADVLVLPSEQVDDVDVEALSESGRVLSRAEAQGSERALLLCAGADPAKVTLRLRPHAGRGAVLLTLSQTTQESEKRNLHPEFPRYDLSPAPGPLPKPAPSARRLELLTSDLTSLPLSWTGCQRVELEPRFPLLGYRLRAFDDSGRLIGEAEAAGPTVMHLCLPRSQGKGARMDLRAVSRSGPIDVRSVEDPAPASPTLERFPLAANRLLGLARDLGFLSLAEDIGQVSAHQLSPDQLVRIPLSVPAARCLTILSAADRSTRGIELGVVSVSTARFADFARGSNVAWARVCADQGKTEELVVELRAPHGETPALLSTRQESITPPSAALPR